MIIKANISDLNELYNLECSLFSPQEFRLSKESLRYHLKKNTILIFKDENVIVGYILWLKRKNCYRLYSLGVIQKYRSQGIAKELLEYSFNTLLIEKYTLEVNCKNYKAIVLYEKYGFKIKKVLKDYYGVLGDGYMMVKE